MRTIAFVASVVVLAASGFVAIGALDLLDAGRASASSVVHIRLPF